MTKFEDAAARRSSRPRAGGWSASSPTAIAPPRRRRLARVPAAAARRRHRRAARRSAARSPPATTGSATRSPCAIRCRAPCRCCRRLLDMPTLRAARRPPHAARAGRRLRRLGAIRGFAGARSGRISASCPAVRPAIRCRRSIAADSRTGRTACRRHSCRARQRISSCCGRTSSRRRRHGLDERSAIHRHRTLRRDARSHDGGECRGDARRVRCSSRASPAPARRSSPRKSRARWRGRCTSGTSSRPARRNTGLYEYDAVSRLRDSQLGEEKVHDIRNYIVKGQLWEAFESEVQPVLLIDEIDKADIEIPERPAARARSHGVLRARDARAGDGAPPAHHPDHQQQREGTARRLPAPLLLPLHPFPGRGDHGEDRPRALSRISRRSCCAKR